jgi:hypothetical protein
MGSKTFHLPSGTYGDPARDITGATSIFPKGSIYRSSNPKVAEVVIEGGRRKLVYGKAGKAIITILKGYRKHMNLGQAKHGNGPRVLAKIQVRVEKAHPILGGFALPENMAVGGTFNLMPPSSSSKGVWAWGSTNPRVLDIRGGTATVIGTGETTVIARQMGTRNYRSGTVAARFLAEEYPTIIWSSQETVYYDQQQPFKMAAPISNSKGGIYI